MPIPGRACMFGALGDHGHMATGGVVDVVAQATTKDGYSFLVLAENTGQQQEFWWTCGGCWSRSPNTERRRDLHEQARAHLVYCSVHR